MTKLEELYEPDVTSAPVNLEEIYAGTEQFEKMPVSEKMKYLNAIADYLAETPEQVSPANNRARIFLSADNISKKKGEITAMLNMYADIQGTLRAIREGVRFFRRGIENRKEERLTGAVLKMKEEYRRLRYEGFTLRLKLLRVICAEEIRRGCERYSAKCSEIRRRRTGKCESF